MTGRVSNGIVFVVFGSSGDLSSTRLIPALERARRGSKDGREVSMIGVDRRPSTGRRPEGFRYVNGDLRKAATFGKLGAELERTRVPRSQCTIFYLATWPVLYPVIAGRLRTLGSNWAGPTRTRIALEKPFGLDLASSRKLQRALDRTFDEPQVYRVDHFLENKAIRGLEAFGAKHGLGSIWDHGRICRVVVRADETRGVDGRGEFYDAVGVVRDMVQNHLLQMACAVATASFGSRGRGDAAAAMLELLKSGKALGARDFVLGQYRSYRNVNGVAEGSSTPTYFRGRISFGGERWKGVPFILRTGKRLRRDLTDVTISFRESPAPLTDPWAKRWNELRLRLDRPEGIDLLFRKGASANIVASVPLEDTRVNEYDEVVRDLISGDRSRFAGRGANELAWRILRLPVEAQSKILRYDDGTDGPPGPPIDTNR